MKIPSGIDTMKIMISHNEKCSACTFPELINNWDYCIPILIPPLEL